jgi:hypothetical protein
VRGSLVVIADGWLPPLYYSPSRQEVYADQLAGHFDSSLLAPQ